MTVTDMRRIIFTSILITGCFLGFSSEIQSPLNRPFNKEILENYRKKSDEYIRQNLNRFALERLQVYDRLLDSLYTREKTDTLSYIEANYRITSADRIISITNLKKEIEDRSEVKADLETSYWSLVKYAALALLFWLLLVIVFIRFRKRLMMATSKNFDTSSTQLESLEELTARAKKLFADFNVKKKEINELEQEIIKLEKISVLQKDKADSNQAVQSFAKRTEQLRKTIDAEKRIVDSVLSQADLQAEKVTVDINTICDAYMEIAFRGINKSEFNCEVTRDFEKKLPGLKMNPSAVGTLLLNVLSNAFESVKEKNELGIKGYKPKVSISTRILPKFLQVRIKDNGTGMNDKLLQSADKEFITTRSLNPQPGLGLGIAKKIIEEQKGEIKIESEEGNSTDVYIKFYLK